MVLPEARSVLRHLGTGLDPGAACEHGSTEVRSWLHDHPPGTCSGTLNRADHPAKVGNVAFFRKSKQKGKLYLCEFMKIANCAKSAGASRAK